LPLGKVYHVGAFPQLEDQMVELTIDFDSDRAGYSPDRVDALIWGFTELMVARFNSQGLYELYKRQSNALQARKTAEAKQGLAERRKGDESGSKRLRVNSPVPMWIV
jgi:hypothetical protein